MFTVSFEMGDGFAIYKNVVKTIEITNSLGARVGCLQSVREQMSQLDLPMLSSNGPANHVVITLKNPRRDRFCDIMFTDALPSVTVNCYHLCWDDAGFSCDEFCAAHGVVGDDRFSYIAHTDVDIALEAGSQQDLLLTLAGYSPYRAVGIEPSRALLDLFPPEVLVFLKTNNIKIPEYYIP